MLFHTLQSQLFHITLCVFFALFILRHLCLKSTLSIFLSHILVCGILFVAAVGGGGIQNDGYASLEKFIELEKNNTFNDAKKNPQNYDSTLAMHLETFKTSEDLRSYLTRNDPVIDACEAISMGWLFLLISDLAMICVSILRHGGRKLRATFYLRRS